MAQVASGLLALLALPAAAEIVELHWDKAGRFEHAATVPAGKFVELCGKLPAGQAVQWQYRGAAPLDFNIHYHVGKEVTYPAKLKATASARDTLHAAVEQDYCWMWSNKGDAPVKLTASLQRVVR